MDGHFVFGDVNSADYNVWIKGGGTYGAASRRFTTETVPGRNGDLTIDDGAFEEKEHPYEAFIGEDFPENIEGFRNAIMSLTGRQILTDTYHPMEFYRARYMRGLEPDVTTLARTGKFTITFSRDPRRFLVAGDQPQSVASVAETTTGSLVTVDNKSKYSSFDGLAASIVPTQSGSGDPTPTNLRPISGWTGANVVRCGKNICATPTFGKVVVNATGQVSNAQAGTYRAATEDLIAVDFTAHQSYYVKWDASVYVGNIMVMAYNANGEYIGRTSGANTNPRTIKTTSFISDLTGVSGDPAYVRVNVYDTLHSFSQTTVDNAKFTIAADQNASLEDYSGTKYTVDWTDEVGTVYGGTIDLTAGVLTVTHAIVDLGDLSWTYISGANARFKAALTGAKLPDTSSDVSSCVCSAYTTASYVDMYSHASDNLVALHTSSAQVEIYDSSYSDAGAFDTAVTGQKLVYPLAAPTTVQLDPQTVAALVGTNNIWADTGDVSVTVSSAARLFNPTLFASKPLIRVHGQGTIYIGGMGITVGGSYPYVDIDTELGDCFYGATNANSVVTFSGNDYPEIQPGTSYVSYTGFSAVEVTPRWWRL